MPYNGVLVLANKRISIIIPAYNEERYLARCLDSVALQVQRPYEVLVVDNNSSDRTVEIAGRYPFVKMLYERQQGRVFAQNKGFAEAKGDILARIDADAVLPADWTERISKHFAHPGALKTAWTGGASFYNVRFPRFVSWAYNWVESRCNWLLTGHPSLWGSSMALPRKAWLEVADDVCQIADLHEDFDLSIHLYEHGYRIMYDVHTKVGVELRPVYARPGVVWQYLSMWPRTLRLHGIWTWIICWPMAVLIFVGMPFFGISERLARLIGRKPRGR
jgi:glycosyltransferase involved in cell wall biosynthesis